ncbi:capZ-interacting protein-like [Erpetoichthys calabaricus]|uniref:FAM21/CAPZIP domain-containing protein n=1 Tax=Erpetoichthys calabaricus TaxID=27687 RepID=A0A8C4X4S8_ERPCA|nr:capZ-interacting protein-like [Erpetoichthys calabaricus]
MESSTAKAKDVPVKRSVAELAGKFGNSVKEEAENSKPNRRRPPSSLALNVNSTASKTEPGHCEEQKGTTNTSTLPPKVRPKSSPLIEKLQANLVFPSQVLPGSPKSPGIKLPTPPFATPPSTPSSPSVRTKSSEEEPATFEKPAETSVLHNINKSRARLSIKRRPPSRRLRKSGSDDTVSNTSSPSEDKPLHPDDDEVFNSKPDEDAQDAQDDNELLPEDKESCMTKSNESVEQSKPCMVNKDNNGERNDWEQEKEANGGSILEAEKCKEEVKAMENSSEKSLAESKINNDTAEVTVSSEQEDIAIKNNDDPETTENKKGDEVEKQISNEKETSSSKDNDN